MKATLRKAAVLALFAAVLTGGSAPRTVLSEQERDDLVRVSAYLNSISTLKGGFIQVGPDGQLDQGMFYLKKPGRLRFEYAAPNPNLIVADGQSIAVENKELKTTDRYPLVSTPLDIILQNNVDMTRDANVVAVERRAGALMITAREDSGPAEGEIMLVFADPGLELRQWVVVDAQGLRTTVVLRDMLKDVELDPKMFVIQEHNRFKKFDY